jgi:3-dehydrosphinganine reductase
MSKTALITGGSSGLGFELAKLLSEQGYVPIILARNQERIESALTELRRSGREAMGFSCDVTDANRLKEVCNKVCARYQSLDFLVINAGVSTVRLLSEYADDNRLKHDLETNLWGAILTTQKFLPLLHPGAKVLFIASGFGLMGPAGYSVYAASKAGMINFAESLRRELLGHSISVHVACPGDMATPQLFEERRAMPEWMKQSAPRGMMPPRVAAETILKKCRRNRFLIIINGEILALILLNKLTPRWFRDFMIDRMFPLPPAPGNEADR